ncbi:uncharacterized protein [Mobula birostris]|uniref:uncharacterized protein n=1 Tax=Mobula birostris TaxID=1983395 RepID=UPI003B2851B7
MDHNSRPKKKLGYNTKDYNTIKPNNCSSHFRYCLLFTSLIQMLIILGLVLFMTYGNTYSSHQSHLETSQNQSVQLIREVQSQKGAVKSLTKNLTSCNFKNGNLTEQLKIMNKTIKRWISQKNYTDYLNLPLNRYFEQYFSLKRNNTDLKIKLQKCMFDQQLKESREKWKEGELYPPFNRYYPFNRRTATSFESSCQENVNLLQKMVDLLNDQLAAMRQKEASMDLKLKEQEARCWNWRMSEYRVKTP